MLLKGISSGKGQGAWARGKVRGRRLTEAAQALVGGERNILDLALQTGYSSRESFSRAFRSQFGVTSEAVRSAGSHSLKTES